MPNQTMNSGIRPTHGMARNMPIDASMTSSPSRNSPAVSDSASATVAPMRKPVAARRPDAAMACGSSPVPIRSAARWTTSTGEASTDSGSTPVALARNQTSTNPRGPEARRTPRGTRKRDRDRLRGAPGRAFVVAVGRGGCAGPVGAAASCAVGVVGGADPCVGKEGSDTAECGEGMRGLSEGVGGEGVSPAVLPVLRGVRGRRTRPTRSRCRGRRGRRRGPGPRWCGRP